MIRWRRLPVPGKRIAAKGLLSLLNIILIIVPLISIIFSTIYVYNSTEFIELLVLQLIKRTGLILSIFTGLGISLLVAFLVGAGLPILLYSSATAADLMMIIIGSILTLAFVSLVVLASVMTRDKAEGIGISILLWFYFALVYDGIILFLLFQFSDYPMEKATIGLSSLNPIDLGRIMILLKLDVAAMMGYTGGVFKDFFGGAWGILLSWIAVHKFNRKDL